MFSLREFVRQAMLKAVGKQEDYKIMQNSLGWYEKEVLTQEDLAEIQTAIDEKNTPVVEEVPEEISAEPAENIENTAENTAEESEAEG